MATIAVEYGVNEEDALYLPCRDSELEEVLRAVNARSSNEITIINVMWPEGLRMLNGLTVDADEMNFLAKRMDSFVPMELMKFIAAASVINDMDTCKLINLSFNTERYTLVQDVTDLAQIGKMRYMSIHGGILPEDQESIDFAEIGRKLLSSGTGIPTEFGLLYENKDEPFETSYNGVNFPAYYYRADFIAGVRLEYSGKSEYLYLPEEPVTIEKALKRLGCPDLVECTVIVECYGNIDDNWQGRMDESFEYEGLYEANHRAFILSNRGLDRDKLLKVLEYSEEVSTEAIGKLAKHLGDFIVIDDAENVMEVGEHFVLYDEMYKAAPEVLAFIDTQALGEYLIQERDGKFISGGFVCMEQGCSYEQIMGNGSPKMELGGM